MSIKLLIIDDDDVIRTLLADFFSLEKKYSIETARTGEQGLLKFKKINHDIVITDLKMPGIDGIEVVKRIKEINAETEIIVITAYGTIETAVEAIKKGAYDFILKPLDFNHITLIINKCYQQIIFRKENKDLREINVRLKELNEEKEKFITITSHELRTPTNAITGLVEMLYESIASPDKIKYEKEFHLLMRACGNLKRIVEEMHDLSIARKGRLPLNKNLFSMDELKNDILSDYKIFSISRKIHFSMDDKSETNDLYGDYRRIRQAVNELIQNAVKYTKDGGTVALEISQEMINDIKHIKFDVCDTGIGISEEEFDKIFDPFYEVQDSIRHHSSDSEFMGGGIGIGLSIVREIALAHDGNVEVKSIPKKGSTFTLLLPLKKETSVAAPAKKHKSAEPEKAFLS